MFTALVHVFSDTIRGMVQAEVRHRRQVRLKHADQVCGATYPASEIFTEPVHPVYTAPRSMSTAAVCAARNGLSGREIPRDPGRVSSDERTPPHFSKEQLPDR